MPRILRLIPARRDLVEHFVFIGEATDTEAAQRFLDSVDKTLEQLAKMPRMGIKRQFRSQKFENVRIWRVKGFEKYLIFYRPHTNGIEVLRVLHAARDIDILFE